MGKILEVSNLTIHIKTHKGIVQAVRDVNFYLNEQETLAVVGESGSGKSITMKGIMGILPKNGKVTEGIPGPDDFSEPDHEDRKTDRRNAEST